MPTETPTKKRETWRDFAGESPPWLTRDELLARLRDDGVDVSARTLAYWESQSVVPRPVRRWVDGAPRVFYPELAVGAVAYLRNLQKEGLNLRAIRPYMEAWIEIQYGHLYADPEAQRLAREKWLPSPEDSEPHITALARRHERVHGGPPIVRAQILFTDAAGHTFAAHSFTPPAPQE